MASQRLFYAVVACALSACAGADDGGDFIPTEDVPPPEVTVQHVQSMRQVDVTRLTAQPSRTAAVRQQIQQQLAALRRRGLTPNDLTAVAAPKPKPTPRATRDSALMTFDGMGINDVDRALGGASGITPPDQALCAGGPYVFEAANTAFQVFDGVGNHVGTPVDLAAFFNFPSSDTAFSLVAHPRCFFDADAGRFFVAAMRIAVDATTMKINGSFLELAVSTSDDPRAGWTVYEVDLVNDGSNGTPKHDNCPCIGDEPALGADANGVYVTTNERGLDPDHPSTNGAQIYAFEKQSLVAGKPPAVVHLGKLVLAEGIASSIQPALSPSGKGSTDANGSEYFLSSLDFKGGTDARIALWALSNTGTLKSSTPALVLEHAVLPSQAYGAPPAAVQKDDSTPLRECLTAGTCPAKTGLGGITAANELQQLSTGDDRMHQTVFAGNRLWSALTTVVDMPSGPRSAIAVFSVEARRFDDGRLAGRVRTQGYVALDDADLMVPAVAMTDDGRGAVAFSLSGTHDYPSAAYARIERDQIGQLNIAVAGDSPLDDITGYTLVDGKPQTPARFNDYSAALINGTTLWMASEAVTAACDTLGETLFAPPSLAPHVNPVDCSKRDEFSNWDTVLSRIELGGGSNDDN